MSDNEDAAPPDDEPWLFRLLNRAAAFGDVIAENNTKPSNQHDHDGDDSPRLDVVGLLGRDLATLAQQQQPPQRPSAVASASPSASPSWQADLVKLGASSWLRCGGKSAGLAGNTSSDPASDNSDDDNAHDDDHDGHSEVDEESGDPLGEEDWNITQITDEPESLPAPPSPPPPPLSAEEKVALIISEFGPLADKDEKETLLVETDASFFQDVAILGVIHLTTHRLAFHASLLNTRPDLRQNTVLHAGPAIVTLVKAFRRRKTRVWMELGHDMLTSYRSSDEHDRVRPLRTVLLSAIRKIYPIDPRRPRVVRIEFVGAPSPSSARPHMTPSTTSRSSSPPPPSSPPCSPPWLLRRVSSWYHNHGWNHNHSNGRSSGRTVTERTEDELEDDDDDRLHSAQDEQDEVFINDAEFATEEAALGWRREIQAALYMYRHRRRVVLGSVSGRQRSKGSQQKDQTGEVVNEETEKETGVRISIPLKRIRAHRLCVWTNFATCIQLDLGAATTSDGWVSFPSPYEPGSGWTTTTTMGVGSLIAAAAAASAPEATHLQFGILKPDAVWNRFGELVRNARAPDDAGAIVDFGALTFVECGLAAGEGSNGASSGGQGDQGRDGETVARNSREKEVRRLFGLAADMDVWITKCSLHRTIATSGLLVLSERFICFWSRLVAASDVKLRFNTADVQTVRPVAHARGSGSSDDSGGGGGGGGRWRNGGRFGLVLQIRGGHSDVHLGFATRSARDEVVQRITALLVAHRPRSGVTELDERMSGSVPTTNGHRSASFPQDASSLARTTTSTSTSTTATTTSAPSATSITTLPPPTTVTATSLLSPLSRTLTHLQTSTFPPALLPHLAKPINVPAHIPFGISSRHFVLLTIGSRGDVQPYIALARGLQQAGGHRVTLVTHEEYKPWVEGWGVEHRTAGGDPGALMKLNVEHKMFSPQFFKESIAHFRTWIDELLIEAWTQCRDADVLIESPSAMAGVHIAEALNIPYFRAFTMPWSKTTQYPHPFISPPVENASFNTASYILFDNVFWLGTSGQINRWRKKYLGLEPTDMGHMAQAKIPFLYNFSPSVVPKPLDWGDQITISGYWFLDHPDLDWTPSPELLQFIAQARKDAKPLVYIGFGSITVPNARAMTRSIVKAVLKSDVRAILSKGWSSRMDKEEGPEVELPPEIFAIDKAPHDWLFPQMDAALHHGGAGTTGASLRAGVPTLIKPWFGDQFFWASRVQKLGAGLRVASLHSADLAEALKKATTDRKIKEKAAAVGERIRQENGVPVAIKAIYTYLHRAGRDRSTLSN